MMEPGPEDAKRDCWTVAFGRTLTDIQYRAGPTICIFIQYNSSISKYYFYALCDEFSGHAYNAHDRCIAAGYDNGDIKLFDLKKMALRWETNVKNGVRKLILIL